MGGAMMTAGGSGIRGGAAANGGWMGHLRPKPPAPFKILEKAGADKSRVTFTVGSGLGPAFF